MKCPFILMCNRLLSASLLVVFSLAACSKGFSKLTNSPHPLAVCTENKVTVEILLGWDENGETWLEAIFTPEEGFHLYSKDIPREGVDGLGRPTLLELVPGSRLKADGELIESVTAIPDEKITGLLLYPIGEVRLVLPVQLPDGGGWFDETITITYMACRENTCYAPVAGKTVSVRVPGIEEIIEP